MSGALIDKIRRRASEVSHDGHLHGPPPKPAAPFDLSLRAGIEADLGFPLPNLLVDVLHQVGDGGFGPGYGLMGLGTKGFQDDQGNTIDALYALFRERPETPPFFRWPEGFLPLCHHGCAMYDCLDVDNEQVVLWEPNRWGDAAFKTAMYPYGVSLAGWLEAWADGGIPYIHAGIEDGTISPLADPKPGVRKRKPHKDQLSFFDKL